MKFAMLLSDPNWYLYMAKYWEDLLDQMSSTLKDMLRLLVQHLHDFWQSLYNILASCESIAKPASVKNLLLVIKASKSN
ncbi:hypothetical protein llap_6678 [Limosa lapponica baueri]|uniref:Uncharacterized protein n=1 Tax=Limosa lapponica baueri TaxID=1758121 RepID=A0A2I0UAE2_LIMLA|nr:hypothetical protein llap_6678 [Limosa lapponica baueri]